MTGQEPDSGAAEPGSSAPPGKIVVYGPAAILAWLRGFAPTRPARNPEPADHAMDEWKECRTTIGRFDGTLADLRKYGFSLVTLLLTASALITNANQVADRVASSSVVIVLVLVLFLMDRYWWVLLRNAVERAWELETMLGIQISRRLGEGAQASHNTLAASVIYGIFVVVAGLVAFVAIVPNWSWLGFGLLLLITASAVGAIVALHVWFEALLPREPGAQGAPPPPPGP
jgi:hypothetical protein